MPPQPRVAPSVGLRGARLPGGTVTLLFTDVEGSTRHLHEVGAERYAAALAEHRRIIREACADAGGVEVDTQGDAFFVAFADAANAVRAAQQIAQALATGPMRVRIGLHTGQPLLGEEGYVGEDVHLGARIAAAGHGGQVLLSSTTRDAVRETIPVSDLGEHRLKDIERPVAIFQLGTDAFPRLKTISNTNLPRPTDSFVGRERELEHIVGALRDGTRLLTLLGPGGTGKTRLAIEAAARLVPDVKAGTFWVDLTPVRDASQVPQGIASVLGTEDDVATFVGEREMLLVVDNLEQVIEAGVWLAGVATACPNLKLLVTSRQRLRVRGEVVVAVPALAYVESVQLFADRSGLEPSAEIDELCRRLENLPLAVELAAARTAVLTPRQILDRLGERLDLLKGGRDADARQRTLRATIEWSHELLNPAEQQLLRRLSVFSGGATLEAIQAVCESDLDTLEALVDKSLMRSMDGRFTMLETVREFAAEQLRASGEREEVAYRHAAFMERLIETRVPELTASGQEDLGRSLAAEFPNLQAAFGWLVEAGDAHGATRFVDAVWWFVGEWLSRRTVGLAMCETALAMPGLSDGDRAALRHREGNFAIQSADIDRARQAWAEAADIARRIGDGERESALLNNLSLTGDDPIEGIRLFERAQALAPPTNERDHHRAQWNLAGLKRRAGEELAWQELAVEVLEWANRVGDFQYIGAVEEALADAALRRGDAAEALERATRSRDLALERDHNVSIVLAETVRCRSALRLGRTDDAVASLTQMLATIAGSDLEADEELMTSVLGTAIEVLAALGEAGLAGFLEPVRLAISQRRPWVFQQRDELYESWLAEHGVQPSPSPATIDLPGAVDRIRGWLASRMATGQRA